MKKTNFVVFILNEFIMRSEMKCAKSRLF